jgi:CO dehydrogenase maturation factor
VIIDSPAGLEHLNRKVTTHVDDIFDVMGPSSKSFEHVKRAYRIAREVKIDFAHFYLVGGCMFPENLAELAEKTTDREWIGRIAFDEKLQEYVLAGRSLLTLPTDSPAYLSVGRILERAGHGQR